MNDAAPRLRPQKMIWSAHGQTRDAPWAAVAMRIMPNRTLVMTPMKNV